MRLIQALRQHYPNIGVYTVTSGTLDEGHRRDIYAQRKALGLESHWLIIEDPLPAAALYARSDLFVRPTITDGDSVSVRECLYFGVPVLASNATKRPEACTLFKSRDFDDMLNNANAMLRNLNVHRLHTENAFSPDYSKELLRTYREICFE